MDLALLVYAISLLGPVDGALTFVNAVILTLVAIGLFAALINAVDYTGEFWRWFKSKLIWMVAIFCFIGAIKTLIPSEKTAYMMVGAYTAQKIAQNPKVEQVGAKVLTIINQKLDQYVDEGVEEAKKAAEKKVADEVKKASK